MSFRHKPALSWRLMFKHVYHAVLAEQEDVEKRRKRAAAIGPESDRVLLSRCSRLFTLPELWD
jgi:hypothetical protein